MCQKLEFAYDNYPAFIDCRVFSGNPSRGMYNDVKHSLQTSQLSQFHCETHSFPRGQLLISHCEPSALTVTHGIQPHSLKNIYDISER